MTLELMESSSSSGKTETRSVLATSPKAATWAADAFDRVRFEPNHVNVNEYVVLPKDVRSEVLEKLMEERRDLRSKARIGSLSITDELLLSEVDKEIKRLQLFDVAEAQSRDQSLWDRLEVAAQALDPALFK